MAGFVKYFNLNDHQSGKELLIHGTLFSSLEHEVLMVSYCDQSFSAVRRPCIVSFLLQMTSPKRLDGF